MYSFVNRFFTQVLNFTYSQFWISAKTDYALRILFIGLISCVSLSTHADNYLPKQTLTSQQLQAFASLYQQELGNVSQCHDNSHNEVAFCANTLKDSGNAPRIFMPANSPKAIIVLFHGLSDSPYFVRSIAQSFQNSGYLVITPLTPGHGKKVAQIDMHNSKLGEKWLTHVNDVMSYTNKLATEFLNDKTNTKLPVFIGGFSAGGTFATWYAMQHPSEMKGVLLFSAALQLPDSAETMSRIWGIKSVANWLDGEFQTIGAHPFKYPKIASFSALMLMDVINQVRDFLSENSVKMPVFSAHSVADKITLLDGVQNVLNQLEGKHVFFKIDEEYDLCHQDLPMSNIQLIGLKFNRTQVNQRERCAVPKPNPVHQQMMLMANLFIQDQLAVKH